MHSEKGKCSKCIRKGALGVGIVLTMVMSSDVGPREKVKMETVQDKLLKAMESSKELEMSMLRSCAGIPLLRYGIDGYIGNDAVVHER